MWYYQLLGLCGSGQVGQVNSSAVCKPGFTNDGNCTHYSIISTNKQTDTFDKPNASLGVSPLSRI